MIESKGWNWEIVEEDKDCIWKNPSEYSYWLLNRWKSKGKKNFLDLGCGLGRHSILFGKNDFNVSCFDISQNAIDRTKEWAIKENLNLNYNVGDMLSLRYEDNSMDAILCINVISHTDTEGIKKVINEIKRVLTPDGECYLTLGSKETYGFKYTDWPMVDENTKLRMDEGPEYKTPHFYADYDLIQELFKDFSIESIKHIGTFYDKNDTVSTSYHYHLLIKRQKMLT